MYKVAVIIPTLNEEKFIANCLNSVINQTYPFCDMDILVVDGGSKDQTKEIVNEYCKKYENVRLLSNPRKIQSVAFNIGVQNSDAPYIVRLDAHALYDPYYIEGCIKGLEVDTTRGNVGGQCHIQSQNNSVWAMTNAILNYSKFGIGGASYRIGAQAGYVDTVPFGSFPRKMIEKIGGMREDLPRGEDNEYNSRIKKAGYKIYFNPDIISVYYARPTFKTSCKQMYANGESIGHLFYIDKEAIGFRHLVPMLFVSSIICGAVLSFIYFPLFYVFFIGIGLYFFCDLIASLFSSYKHGWKFFIPLFLMFFCVHVSYGYGTIIGFLTGRKFINKR